MHLAVAIKQASTQSFALDREVTFPLDGYNAIRFDNDRGYRIFKRMPATYASTMETVFALVNGVSKRNIAGSSLHARTVILPHAGQVPR